jgi:crotonobetainyl-CoA:carnitine CoA-transferase CaiB-like acyl-CoA transferase
VKQVDARSVTSAYSFEARATVPAVTGALGGIRILDLTRDVAGPLGVLLLAEHGADVVKVEPPGGDRSREYEGTRVWYRSRRSIELDLTSGAGRDEFDDLVRACDLVVESFRPDTRDRLGLAYERLAGLNDRVILVSCGGYPDGHRRAGRFADDALVQASSGQMWEQPGWRMGPVFCHMPMPSMGACYLVAIGALSALHARSRTGRGQHVRTSLFQGALLYTTQIWQDVERATAQFHELMGKSYPPGIHQQMIFECADHEWIHLSIMSGLTPVKSQDEILGLEDAPDPFTFMALPAEEREKVNARRRERFKEWNRDALVEEFRSNNHAAEAIIPPAETFAHPQTVANDMTATVADPEVGVTTQMGVPIHLLGTPGAIRGPRPRAGEGAAAVREEWLRTPGEAVATPHSAHQGLALEGLRVVDFGQYLAGPFGPMILADLGADVVKVEPVTGDGMRLAGKPFFGCQRGKRSIALNVKDPRGLELALELVRSADVVHHNMTRGVATKLGIDDAGCRAVRPDIIYCNTYAYGLPDPLGRFGGLDPLYQASSGLEYESGAVHEGGAPLYYRFGMCDASNALLSIVGVLLALHHRDRTGEGQELWTSLHDGGVIFSSDVWLDAGGEPWDRPRLDRGLHGLGATYRLYATQDEQWILIAVRRDDHWRALCGVLGLAHLAGDERFATAAARATYRRELETLLEPAFRTKTARAWHRHLDDAGVPNELPVDTEDGLTVLWDADCERLGLVAEYEHPLLGRTRQFGALIDFSATPGKIWGPPPLVGQHTRELLHGIGLLDGDVDALLAAGVCYEPDAGLVEYRSRFSN